MTRVDEEGVFTFDVELGPVPTEAFPESDTVQEYFKGCVHNVGDICIGFGMGTPTIGSYADYDEDQGVDVIDIREELRTFIEVSCPKLMFKQGRTFAHQGELFRGTVTLLADDRTMDITQGFELKKWGACCYEIYHSQEWPSFRTPVYLTPKNTLRFRISIEGNFKLQNANLNGTLFEDPLIKMWHDKLSTDFFIAAKGEAIRCHRSVLAAASPVFKGMMHNDMQEGLQAFASIDELPVNISLMVEFMYTKCLPLTVDCISLVSLMRLADCYQLPHLFQVCISRIPSMVNQTNIVDVISGISYMRGTNIECEQLFQALLRESSQDLQLLDAALSAFAAKTARINYHQQMPAIVATSQDLYSSRNFGRCGDGHAPVDGEYLQSEHQSHMAGVLFSTTSIAKRTLTSIALDTLSKDSDSDGAGAVEDVEASSGLGVQAVSYAVVQSTFADGEGLAMHVEGTRSGAGPRRKTRRSVAKNHNREMQTVPGHSGSWCTHDSWQ